MTTSKKATRSTKATAARSAKPAPKATAKQATAKAKRPLLTKAQRSEVAQRAAFKAHHHKTFMRLHASAAKNASTKDNPVSLQAYLKTLPSFNESLRD